MKEKTQITITRQYGSGGREVAELIAKKLNIHRYDQKIVSIAAERMGKGGNVYNIIKDSYNVVGDKLSSFDSFFYEKTPDYNRQYIEQAKVILEIAKNESAVFLGRCADAILADVPETYSFFIYADDDFRQNRAKAHYKGCSLKELNAIDAQRKYYYGYYTGRNWGEPQNYDLMINTSKLSLEDAADLIIEYIEKRQSKAVNGITQE